MAETRRAEARITTTIRVPRHVWTLLRQLAEQKALEDGGRPSVSGVIVCMAEATAKPAAAKRA